MTDFDIVQRQSVVNVVPGSPAFDVSPPQERVFDVVPVQDAAPAQVTLSYDVANRLIEARRGGRAKTLTYDVQGRLATTFDNTTRVLRTMSYDPVITRRLIAIDLSVL